MTEQLRACTTLAEGLSSMSVVEAYEAAQSAPPFFFGMHCTLCNICRLIDVSIFYKIKIPLFHYTSFASG